MKKKALIILADGFEEVEAITPIDILRRSEIEVITAGLGKEEITGTHNITVKTDVIFEEYDELPDAIVLPGGMPGAENLAISAKVKELISKMDSKGRLIGAICASPALVLAPTGILDGKNATCYPGMDQNFPASVKSSKERVVQDGNIITSMGPATAFDFGLKMAENLVGKQKSDMVGQQMLFKGRD